MAIRLNVLKTTELSPRIVVFGVGGAGGNAVNNMIDADLQGVEFVVANTDAQALARSKAERRVQIGLNTTQGLGAGAQPHVGMAAAEESQTEILEHLSDTHMVFITAGMGGGTGTGAAPVIARTAKEQGILTVAVVTKPFHFEGQRRMRMADAGLAELQKHVDTLIVIPNQNLFRVANDKTTFNDAFNLADQVLHSGVRGITDLMVMPGLINLDFADVRAVMSEMGKAMMGTGQASGERRAIEAATAAINNPLLEDVSLKGARGVLINITGGNDMTLFEVDEAANHIRNEVDPDANIIVGSTFDDTMEGMMRVSVVATGIEAEAMVAGRPQPAPQPAQGQGGPQVIRRGGVDPIIHAPPVRAPEPANPYAAAQAPQAPAPQPQSAPVAPQNQPLFQQPAAASAQAPIAAPSVQPTYAAQQPRPQLNPQTQARPDPYAEAARRAPRPETRPETRAETRQDERASFGGFNIFGRPKTRPHVEDREEERRESERQRAQSSPLFENEFEDEIEIPTFLRRQAN
jgi:cell division protein FtsZ